MGKTNGGLMRVQIIGVGVVGTAQAYLATQLGHEVIGVDRSKTTSNYATIVREFAADVDVTFVCTQEASVPGVITSLIEKKVKGLYVIKSTVPCGTTRRLMGEYNIHICHNPEFLREKSVLADILHPRMVVIGQCCAEHGNILREYYRRLGAPIMTSNPTTTETVKLTLNSYLSTLITFWNEINRLSSALGASTEEVASIVKLDQRVSAYGTEFFGMPFSGKCLPKDMDQLISVFHQAGVDPSVFEAMREFNKSL
jgi:nucleotide sugar dehydrogenase